MSISLQKGQKIDLTKGNAGLSRIVVGLGWDPVKKSGGGLLGSLFGGGGGPQIDCDASVLMLNEQNRLESKQDIIYFGNLQSHCGSVRHTGDNLTGDGDGDDEQIIVDLSRVPARIHKLVFVVNIYDCRNRKQDFGMIQNAFIRIVDMTKNSEISRFNLTENYAGRTTLIVGEIYRYNGEWKFGAIGEGTMEGSLGEIAQRYQ
ncbi:TerD family protein [Aneurinibacillus terranovensis]|uniref:TerD family protein n=1 Tax=Aneurinibacillus terranovensis TaxID=278991 RepID=UPI000424B57C|nr:TerD family protein [Aneurinibacillus terranovensis]